MQFRMDENGEIEQIVVLALRNIEMFPSVNNVFSEMRDDSYEGIHLAVVKMKNGAIIENDERIRVILRKQPECDVEFGKLYEVDGKVVLHWQAEEKKAAIEGNTLIPYVERPFIEPVVEN